MKYKLMLILFFGFFYANAQTDVMFTVDELIELYNAPTEAAVKTVVKKGYSFIQAKEIEGTEEKKWYFYNDPFMISFCKWEYDKDVTVNLITEKDLYDEFMRFLESESESSIVKAIDESLYIIYTYMGQTVYLNQTYDEEDESVFYLITIN